MGHAGRRHALQVRLDRRRERCRHSVLDLLRAAADVPREAARTRRLRVARRAVGTGPGTAGRLHQEGDRLSARRQQLRRLPQHAACARARRERRSFIAAGPGHTTNSKASSASSSIARRIRASTPDNVLCEIRTSPSLSWVDKADLPLPDHSDHEEAPARAREAVRVDVPRRDFPTGAAAATTR